jgi:hypothetical protein
MLFLLEHLALPFAENKGRPGDSIADEPGWGIRQQPLLDVCRAQELLHLPGTSRTRLGPYAVDGISTSRVIILWSFGFGILNLFPDFRISSFGFPLSMSTRRVLPRLPGPMPAENGLFTIATDCKVIAQMAAAKNIGVIG